MAYQVKINHAMLYLPCSLMASLNDMRQAGGECSASRTEEVSTQEVLTHRATVRLHGLSGCSSWRLGSVSINQTSPWPKSLLWSRNRKGRRQTQKNTDGELLRNTEWPRKRKIKKETLHNKSLQSKNMTQTVISALKRLFIQQAAHFAGLLVQQH